MDSTTILIGIVVSLAIIFAVYYYVRTPGSASNAIIAGVHNGKQSYTSPASVPTSLNQKQGLTFTYNGWIKVDDFAYRMGKEKVIFSKGSSDASVACPALVLDKNTNTLIFKIDTFGAQESIPVPDIPAKKWFHFAMVVDQDSVDIYINGILKTHQSLAQLPRQNSESVIVCPDGGFDGKIATLNYYDFYMDPTQVANSVGNPPAPSKEEVTPPSPPYFDLTWWIGRRD